MMKKDEIRILLMVSNKPPKYYSDNEERKIFFMELLKENYPYAIREFASAPAMFIEKWSKYKDEHFQMIWPLYLPNSSEEVKRTYYAKTYDKKADLKVARSSIEDEFWKLSTIELLYLFKKWHKKAKDAKPDNTETKRFHEECIEKLNKVIKQAEEERKEATEVYEKAEFSFLRSDLLSDTVSDDKKEYVTGLLKKYALKVYTVSFLKEVCSGYKAQEWLELYMESLINYDSVPDLEALTIELYNHPVAQKLNTDILMSLFQKNNSARTIYIFERIENFDIFDRLFARFAKLYNKPDVVGSLVKQFLDKFPESGEAIRNTVEYVNEGRSSVNSLPITIEERAKQWLLNINSHNRTDEICSVIEALNNVEKLEELFYDFSFWKKMESCNAFISVVDAISFIAGFDVCYEMIRKNYLTAHIFEAPNLKNNWLKSANYIAIHYEDAQKPYVLFIGELIDQSSVLDERQREVLTKETIYYLLQQAADIRKLYDLQVKKNEDIQTDYIQNMIFHLCSPVEKMEKTLIAYSTMPGADPDTFKIFRNILVKIRDALDKIGVHPLIDSADWEKCKIVPFDPKVHECTEMVREGEGVLCLSMGMRDDKNGFFEKANVRLFIEEKENGGNI